MLSTACRQWRPWKAMLNWARMGQGSMAPRKFDSRLLAHTNFEKGEARADVEPAGFRAVYGGLG